MGLEWGRQIATIKGRPGNETMQTMAVHMSLSCNIELLPDGGTWQLPPDGGKVWQLLPDGGKVWQLLPDGGKVWQRGYVTL